MLTFSINSAGKKLPGRRSARLEETKKELPPHRFHGMAHAESTG
jgi:hypothetical protein